MTAAHQEGKFSIQYLKKSEVFTENKFQIELLTFYCFWMFCENRFVLVSLFNGISTFVGYLMPKPFSKNNSSGTI